MPPSNRTIDGVRRQTDAMGSELFEVGLFKPDARAGEAIMIPRVWDREARSGPYLGSGARIGKVGISMFGLPASIISRFWTI